MEEYQEKIGEQSVWCLTYLWPAVFLRTCTCPLNYDTGNGWNYTGYNKCAQLYGYRTWWWYSYSYVRVWNHSLMNLGLIKKQ